ncbi:MAG: FeoA family protein [Archaeoglobaceae archaeon]
MVTTLDSVEGKVKIMGIVGGKGFVRRLADMGLMPGKVVEVVSKGPPIVVRVMDSEIAIGRGIARKILVEVLNG